MSEENYFELNRQAWNNITPSHVDSDFYALDQFRETKNDLPEIDRNALGDLKGKKVLHLQCHFGMNTLSMAHLGAEVTGVDISDTSIQKAKELSSELNLPARFIRSAIYELSNVLDEQFDIVYTSWGALCWLPDMKRWAEIVNALLRPGGKVIICEFHPTAYLFDDEQEVGYSYFNAGVDVETFEGSYTENNTGKNSYASWSHSLSEIMAGLRSANLVSDYFQEYDYSPYKCFTNMEEIAPGKYVFKKFGRKIPYGYVLTAKKPEA